MKDRRVIDFLIQYVKPYTKYSNSHFRRLCLQGGVTFIDPPGWGVFENDKVKTLDPDQLLSDLYGNEVGDGEFPEMVKFGKREVVKIDTGFTVKIFKDGKLINDT